MIPILGRGDRSVIQVGYRRGQGAGPALLEFRLHGRGEAVSLATVEARAVGLPETYDELLARGEVPEFRFPATPLKAIAGELARRHSGGEPIWVSLDAPRRMTALVPWERLLAPVGLGPVLRAPQLPLVPVAPVAGQRVALCANLAGGQGFEALPGIAGLIRESLEQQGRGEPARTYFFLHVDSKAASEILAQVGSWFGALHSPSVALYVDQGESAPLAESPEGPTLDLRHPWLRWVKSTLDGRGVDRVVLLAEARLFPGRAALALGHRGPPSGAGVDLVRADEFDLFVTQLGACRVELHSIRRGLSDLAMRLFAEDLSWTVPGTVMAYQADEGAPRLAEMIERLLGRRGPSGGAPPVATRYAAEVRPIEWKERPEAEVAGLEQYTLAKPTLRGLLEGGQMRGWFGAVQRRLERQVAGLLRNLFTDVSEPGEVYAARLRGIISGMESVVAAVERHLDRFGPGSEITDMPPIRPRPGDRDDREDEEEELRYHEARY